MVARLPIDAGELVDHAEAEGLGAIAVTDHNVFGGALEAADYARSRDLIVIPGEEVKTDDQGEVIGLFLQREIPRGMSFADTIAAIREQDGLVYVPHPFDRMHAIPDPRTLHRHLADIDVLEVYNARLLFEGYNDEALRFARKYNLTMGAGSDAHVLQGVGTGALRMRAFRDPEEFLISLRSGRDPAPAEVARLPAVAQVGRPGQGKGPLGERERSAAAWPTAVTTDEIYERYLRKAITEINRLSHEIAQAADGAPTALPDRPSAREHLPAQVRAAGAGAAGGRRVPRPGRQRADQVAAAPARRPDGGLRDELRQVRRLRPDARRRVAAPRAAHRRAEARRRDGRGRARVPERRRLPALVPAGRE